MEERKPGRERDIHEEGGIGIEAVMGDGGRKTQT